MSFVALSDSSFSFMKVSTCANRVAHHVQLTSQRAVLQASEQQGASTLD
jgi:hypothetical protein